MEWKGNEARCQQKWDLRSGRGSENWAKPLSLAEYKTWSGDNQGSENWLN